MKLHHIIVIFYVIASAFIGTFILGFAIHLIDLNDLVFQLNEIYYSLQPRIATGSLGLALILLSLLFAQLISAKREREKTIAFNNPSGQVTITLFAVEDLIRKIGQEYHQIKEIRPDVVATKKRGIQATIKLVLKTEVNIPEFTAQLQETVINKIQEILGVEEQIAVRIHILKIQSQQEKTKKKNESIIEEGIDAPYRRL